MEAAGLTDQLLAIIASLVALLVALVGWIGNRIFQRMDSIQNLLREAEKDLRLRIDNHETRISRVEARCEVRL